MITNKEMDASRATLQFIGYRVDKMFFSLKSDSSAWPEKITLSPSFNRTIRKIDEKTHEVSISVALKQENLPFEAELSLTGNFIYEDVDPAEKMIKINAVSILYPYVRSTLSMITNLAGIPPVTIPTINFVQMYEDIEASSSK